MRASAKPLVYLMAIGLCGMASTAFAVPRGAVSDVTSLFGLVVQLNSTPANRPGLPNAKTEAEQWLQQAKQAMQKGEFDRADYSITKAEQLARQLKPVDGPLNYTPQQARQELVARRGQPAAATGQPGMFPVGGSTAPVQGPNSTDRLLRDTRRILANGNVEQAAKLLSQEKRAVTGVASNGDSVERVERLIRSAYNFTNGAASNNPGYNHAYAMFLLEQSEGLILHGEYAFAEGLAQKAKGLPVQYRQNEKTPDNLLSKLAAVRGGRPVAGASSGKEEASRLLAQAQLALDRGDLNAAQQLTTRARQLNVADSEFGANQVRPWEMELKIREMAKYGGVAQAGYTQDSEPSAVAQGVYRPNQDNTHVAPVGNVQPAGASSVLSSGFRGGSQGEQLYRDGLSALNRQDRVAALNLFRQAWQYQDQMDPGMRQELKDKLNSMSPAVAGAGTVNRDNSFQKIGTEQQMLRQKIQQDVFRERAVAERMRDQKDPRGAMRHLEQLRMDVDSSQLEPAYKGQLLTVVDREIQELQTYMNQNAADIRNEEVNTERLADVRQRRVSKAEMENQVAKLVEEFNKLLDENRHAEAEVVARQAYELGEGLPVVELMMWKIKFAKRLNEQLVLKDRKEQAVVDTLVSVDAAAEPFDDRNPIRFPEDWETISGRGSLSQDSRSPDQLRIRNILRTTSVNVHFKDMPLSEAMDNLSKLAGVNIYLESRALAAQGIASDTPIRTSNLNKPISLESALDIILSEFELTFEIENEVVRITTEELKNQNTVRKVYYVADLVVPIPNFVPNYQMGLPAALANAYKTIGYGGGVAAAGNAPLTLVDSNGGDNRSASAWAQQLPDSPLSGGQGGAYGNGANGMGPGGMGGGSLADFDSLIELVQTTVAPDSWDAVGGPGSMSPFYANLSLVISTTQEIHEQIQALLDQLRRLQDLQITIEVRFITLNDDFFERIGVDFNFRINDSSNYSQAIVNSTDEFNPGVTVGLNQQGVTPDLDLAFTQGSFSTVPAFGSPDLNTAANFGFAILSDIEVFLLVQAAKGDQRTNILQAPKVTLYNGQTASVQDTQSRPFVTSIVPVVGDFAAAQQPVIVVLNEGTQLHVQGVVSDDRRFVRLTMVPFFSEIGNVEEFTFEGSTTTTSGTAVVDPTDPSTTLEDGAVTTVEGTTVQLPVFAFTSVTTTVNVPDGGTVLLGGIKRLREQRTERGVPLLSNLPYVNRFFKNTAVGRESSSLMMMVTPRIIIQEEEERDQVGGTGN